VTGSLSDWDRVERYLGRDALAQLATKTVAIIGLGSGGGFVAQSLAMSGVGRFVLIDDDILEPSNVVRHVADVRYVGQPKVQAVAELIRQRNSNAQIEAIVGRLADYKDKLNGVDLVIAGVDGERIKYEINAAARERGLTAIYAGVYERGEGGDVVVIRPAADSPCYACWAEQLRSNVAEALPGELGDTNLDYGMIGLDGTLAAEPGLWLHVVRIAAAHADRALNELLIGQPIHRTYPANTVILANVALEIFDGVLTPPYSAQWIEVPRNPNCLVCGTSQTAPQSSDLSLSDLAGDLLTETTDEADELDRLDTQEHSGRDKP
jgi:molybdopterin/thiamine biosynthesis adenylyltransferase